MGSLVVAGAVRREPTKQLRKGLGLVHHEKGGGAQETGGEQGAGRQIGLPEIWIRLNMEMLANLSASGEHC